MSITITPLAQALIAGSIPRSGPTRIRTLEEAFDAPVRTWARTRNAISEVGHYIFQKLELDARIADEWQKNCSRLDTHLQMAAMRDWVCAVAGGTVWRQIDSKVSAARNGEAVEIPCIQMLENHAESNPQRTRLVICSSDIVPWATAALLNKRIPVWVGFSAVRFDAPRCDGSPSMCGLTAELARKLH